VGEDTARTRYISERRDRTATTTKRTQRTRTRRGRDHFIIIKLDLSKYPYLQHLAQSDKEQFVKIMQTYHDMAENAAMTNFDPDLIKRTFDMSWNDFVRLLHDVFFDYKGIVRQHHDPQEAKAMRILGIENHPLSVFLGESPAYDAKGEPITLQEYTTAEDITDFFQSMLYGLRYVSSRDLAHYLMLGEFDLINNLKMQNVEKLLDIQPALQFQKEHDIPIGKRLKGTGFFYIRKHNLVHTDLCPACKSRTLYQYENHIYCESCKAVAEVN
jgi:hypothetical protein